MSDLSNSCPSAPGCFVFRRRSLPGAWATALLLHHQAGGINDLPQSKVEELAQALETTPAALLGLGRALRLSPGLEPPPTMAGAADRFIACARPSPPAGTSRRGFRRGSAVVSRISP